MESILLNNQIYKKNIEAFKVRFLELFKILEKSLEILPEDIEIIPTKADSKKYTAKYKDQFLHSAYNPEREAEKLLDVELSKNQNSEVIVFYGFGLGYLPLVASKKYKDKTLVLVEPNVSWLSMCFANTDFTDVFKQKNLIFCIEANIQGVLKLLESLGLKNCCFIKNPIFQEHNKKYFLDLDSLIQRNLQKDSINARTLKVFSKLWFTNMCKNLNQLGEKQGIKVYENKAENLPAVLIAAGPSLDRILPFLSELKKRCILISVDTALRSLLSYGIEPHFVVLTDPQYYNARHFDRLKAPNTILITELAAYPSVFRFSSRETFLCSSMFTLGQYLEKRTELKGKLGTGGSVASSAWDFARFIGCKKIYLAGLDLGFPQKRTHTKNSTFEQNVFTNCKRIQSSENSCVSALYGANTFYKTDYLQNQVLTDNRMSMYAWWFESKVAEFSDLEVSTITPEGLNIPGIKISSVENLLGIEENQKKIQEFIEKPLIENQLENQNRKEIKEKLILAVKELKNYLKETKKLVEQGLALTKTTGLSKNQYPEVFYNLSQIDKKLVHTEASELISLLFPSGEDLEIFINQMPKTDKEDVLYLEKENLKKSRAIYTKLLEAITEYEKITVPNFS